MADAIWNSEGETGSWRDAERQASDRLGDRLADVTSRSDFYREKLGKDVRVSSVADLRHLPFTTKAETKASQEASPPFGSHLAVDRALVKKVYQTSGSTGAPTLVAVTHNDIRAWRSIGARSYTAAGVRKGAWTLTTFGAGPFVAGHTHSMLEMMDATLVPIGPGDTERALAAMDSGIVDTIIGTPSFLLHLANIVEERNLGDIANGVDHLVSGGEPGGGLPAVRGRIEAAFEARLCEIMGLGDIAPSLFGECAAQDGMHFCGQDHVWPELVAPDSGEPLAIEPGVRGELVYTTLDREAMPLIRFRSGDLAEVTGWDCTCGRTSFRIRCVGRTDDMIIVRGINVYPSAVADVVAAFRPSLTGRARVVVAETAGVSVPPPVLVEVEVAATAELAPDLAQRVADSIHRKLLFRADVRLVAAAEFGDSSYKTRPLIRRSNPEVPAHGTI